MGIQPLANRRRQVAPLQELGRVGPQSRRRGLDAVLERLAGSQQQPGSASDSAESAARGRIPFRRGAGNHPHLDPSLLGQLDQEVEKRLPLHREATGAGWRAGSRRR
jgi:hypothetical protein